MNNIAYIVLNNASLKSGVMTPSTAFRYRSIAVSITRRFTIDNPSHSREIGDILQSAPFQNWLSDLLAPTLSRSTWRLYRASLAHESSSINDDLPERYRSLPIQLAQPRPRSTAIVRTTSQRQRSLPDHQRREIVNQLLHRQSSSHILAISLLTLGSLTGLRPTEWPTARLETIDDRLALVVLNAKQRRRTLFLDNLSEPDQLAISDLIDIAIPHDRTSWRKRCDRAQDEIQRITRKLFPKATRWPTVYSARHQAALNMRDAGYSPTEIAAAMGHIDPKTATRNYGRRRSDGTGGGSQAPVVKPSAVDVAHVSPYKQPSKLPELSELEQRLANNFMTHPF